MSFVAKLVSLVREAVGPDQDAEPLAAIPEDRLAAAALLVHVARVDGIIAKGEREALVSLLSSGFGLDRDGATALIARAESFDLEVDDVGALVEMLGHEGDGLDRTRLLAMAYRVADADAGLGEFEEDLLWRLGHLLDLDDARIAEIRAAHVGSAARGDLERDDLVRGMAELVRAEPRG